MMNKWIRQTDKEQIEIQARQTGSLSEKRNVLQRVTRQLELAGVDYAIGGSGMLLGLGLTDTVRDWDIMTEAPEKEIRSALESFTIVDANGPSDFYKSAYKLRLENLEPEIEIIGGFAVRTETGICRLPALSGGRQGGLRIASPEIWFAAYTLMERTEKAALLETYLSENGADPSVLSHLRKEPLPQELAELLKRLESGNETEDGVRKAPKFR